jgi:hypothetical protein
MRESLQGGDPLLEALCVWLGLFSGSNRCGEHSVAA